MIRLLAGSLVLAALLLATAASAKTDSIRMGKFKLHLKNGEYITGHNGVMTSQEFTWDSNERGKITYPKGEIARLQRRAGYQSALFGALGSGVGAVYALSTQDRNSDIAPRQLRSIGIGFLVGVAVGAFFPRWEDVQLETPKKHADVSIPFGISVAIRF